MLASSVFDFSWFNCIPAKRPLLFLTEGVFPYFDESEARRVFLALAERFPGSEMVVDILSPFMVQASAVIPMFRGFQVRPRWGMLDMQKIENWGGGIRVLDRFGYFDAREPRLASIWWMARFPVLRDIAHVVRLELGTGRS